MSSDCNEKRYKNAHKKVVNMMNAEKVSYFTFIKGGN